MRHNKKEIHFAKESPMKLSTIIQTFEHWLTHRE